MTIRGADIIAMVTGGVLEYIPHPISVIEGGVQTFDEILVTNAPILLDAFGEDGIYRPGVLNREIQVIIRYVTDDGQVAPVVGHRSPIVNIKVANDSVLGISVDEFVPGYEISLPPRKGAVSRFFSLARILKQDAGMVTIEVH